MLTCRALGAESEEEDLDVFAGEDDEEDDTPDAVHLRAGRSGVSGNFTCEARLVKLLCLCVCAHPVA